MAGASAALATSNDMARDLCQTDMVENQGAETVKIEQLRRHDNVPFVYGAADFADAQGVHFRCRVYDDRVTEVRFLVSDPSLLDGAIWSEDRPSGPTTEPTELTDAAMAPPAVEAAEPRFEKPPMEGERRLPPEGANAADDSSGGARFEKAPAPAE
ncbi:hypothetical protein [Tropicimonas isoalkanivorans]|uniref:Uncharacterized protein n=1 Tax=Tropicimonas isoalkanivorans TaxID=441112 RepID=A0A1I1E7H2_9RHOB|nr:hypothetical protein [Tropicimonas isoalkanivorans]SFB83089.1 hypothetical protein SAMN04488094_101681 [Tropicimonas isoalkanivorans]